MKALPLLGERIDAQRRRTSLRVEYYLVALVSAVWSIFLVGAVLLPELAFRNFRGEMSQHLLDHAAATAGREIEAVLLPFPNFIAARARIIDLERAHSGVRIYLLDYDGGMLATSEPLLNRHVWHHHARVEGIRRLLVRGDNAIPIRERDPRKTADKVYFSAAQVEIGTQKGYVYAVWDDEVFATVYGRDYNSVTWFRSERTWPLASLTLILFVLQALLLRSQSRRTVAVPLHSSSDKGAHFSDFESRVLQMARSIETEVEDLREKALERRTVLAGMTAEVNVPLAELSECIERLKKESTLLDSDPEVFVGLSAKTTGIITQVNRYLDLLDLESKTGASLDLQPYPLLECVHDVALQLGPASGRNIVVSCDFTSGGPVAWVDVELLHRAYGACLERVIQYSSSSDIVLGVREDSEHAYLEVTSRGCVEQEDARGSALLGVARMAEAHRGWFRILQDRETRASTFQIALPKSAWEGR